MGPERRRAPRFELSLPIVVRAGAQAREQSRTGQTRDVSARGVYFVIDERLEPGSSLDFMLTLPAELTRGTEVFVKARGKVIRVDRLEDRGTERLGVAALIEKYDIVRAEVPLP